jgi:hypothetical protein
VKGGEFTMKGRKAKSKKKSLQYKDEKQCERRRVCNERTRSNVKGGEFTMKGREAM